MIVEYAANEGEIFTEGIFYPLVGLGVLPEPILQNRTTRVPLNLFENVMKTKFFYGRENGQNVLLEFENLKKKFVNFEFNRYTLKRPKVDASIFILVARTRRKKTRK